MDSRERRIPKAKTPSSVPLVRASFRARGRLLLSLVPFEAVGAHRFVNLAVGKPSSIPAATSSSAFSGVSIGISAEAAREACIDHVRLSVADVDKLCKQLG